MGLLCSTALLPVGAVQAQVVLASADETAGKDAETIIVTGSRIEGYKVDTAQSATKTDVPLLDTPMSVQVISSDVIRDMGATDLYSVVRNVSGVTRRAAYWGQSTATFNIRGFNLDDDTGYLKDGFRYYAEGTVVLGNVQQVEILKGPASVLYGRSQPGGVANLVTKSPSAAFDAGFEFSTGRWNSHMIRADINGALDADGALMGRIDAEYEDADSFRDFIWNKTLMVSPQLKWEPGEATTVRLRTEVVWDRRRQDYGIPAFEGKPADVPISRFYGEPFNYQETVQVNALLSAEHHFSDDWLIRGGLSYYTLRYQPGTNETYNSWLDGETLYRDHGEYPHKYTTYKTAQVEAVGEFDTLGLGHTLLLGADYSLGNEGGGNGYRWGFNADWGALPVNIFDPVRYGTLAALEADLTGYVSYLGGSETKSWSLYIQDQIDLTDKLKLLLGGRYDNTRQSGAYTGLYNGETALDGDGNVMASDGDILWEGVYGFKASAFSPRAGLLYKLTDGISAYVSWSKSFNPNYGDCDASGCQQFPAEKAVQYEGGVKFEGFDGRFSATGSLFWIEKNNVLQTDPNDPNKSVVDGKHRSKGFEFDVQGRPLDGLSIIASYAYIDAIVAASSDYLVGGQLANSAKHTASLWVSYDWKLGDGSTLSVGGGGNYQSGRNAYSPVAADDIVILPSYVVADAMIAYETADEWRVALNVSNIGNKRYYESSTGWGAAVIYPGTPRGWRLSLSKRF